MTFTYLILILSVIILILLLLYFLITRPREGYVKVESIFTPAELKFYKILKESLPEYAILGKVRVADIINVDSKKAKGKYLKYFNRISKKHVDFLICDRETFSPLVAIELDDKSHERKERVERDEFMDKAFKMAALPLLRIKVQKDYDTKEIREKVKNVLR